VPKTVVDTSEEEWDWVVDVCLKGVFFGCKYAIPQMIKQGGGVIINTASGAGIEGVPNLGAYQAAKGGVVIMSKGIALDFARHKIRCVSICPGVIETPTRRKLQHIPAGASQVMWERTGSMHPIGRNGKPEEVGALAAFLASDEAGFITGSPCRLTVDSARALLLRRAATALHSGGNLPVVGDRNQRVRD